MTANLPPKTLIETLLFLINEEKLSREIKQAKTQSLIDVFGSIQNAEQYITDVNQNA